MNMSAMKLNLGNPDTAIAYARREFAKANAPYLRKYASLIAAVKSFAQEERAINAAAIDAALRSPVITAKLAEYEKEICRLQIKYSEQREKIEIAQWKFAQEELLAATARTALARSRDANARDELRLLKDVIAAGKTQALAELYDRGTLATKEAADAAERMARDYATVRREKTDAIDEVTELPLREYEDLVAIALVVLADGALCGTPAFSFMEGLRKLLGDGIVARRACHWHYIRRVATAFLARLIEKTVPAARTRAESERCLAGEQMRVALKSPIFSFPLGSAVSSSNSNQPDDKPEQLGIVHGREDWMTAKNKEHGQAHEKALEIPTVQAKMSELNKQIDNLVQQHHERDAKEADQSWRFAEAQIKRVMKYDEKQRKIDPNHKSELSPMFELADRLDAGLDAAFAKLKGTAATSQDAPEQTCESGDLAAKETASAKTGAPREPLRWDDLRERDALKERISELDVALNETKRTLDEGISANDTEGGAAIAAKIRWFETELAEIQQELDERCRQPSKWETLLQEMDEDFGELDEERKRFEDEDEKQ